jgi:hypothetical protein
LEDDAALAFAADKTISPKPKKEALSRLFDKDQRDKNLAVAL